MPRRRTQAISTEERAVAQHLKQVREARNLTQVELGKRLGLDQTLISAYETGRVRMHAALVADLARILRTSADELLGLKKAKHNGLVKSRGLRRRLAAIDRLPPRDLRALLQTIDKFLKASDARH